MRQTRRLAAPALFGVLIAMCAARPSGHHQLNRDQNAPATVGTASVAGTVVVDEPNGRPLRRVMVSMSSRSAGATVQRQTTTDDQGRFLIANLPAGTYSPPRATKGGYVDAAYGQRRPDGVGVPLTLADGQRLTIALKLLRGAVITGIIQDNGRPVVGTSVTATPVRIVNGVRTSIAYRYNSALTDDRGVYRMYGLAPGDYVVAASPRFAANTEIRPITDAEIQWAERQLKPDAIATSVSAVPAPTPAQSVAYAPVYFPGTADPSGATTVALSSGQERSGVDFSVSYIPTSRLEGSVLGPDGQPVQNAQINLIPMIDISTSLVGDAFMFESILMNRPTVSAGRFSITGVKPGTYTLAVRGSTQAPSAGRQGGPPVTNLWAAAEVNVNGQDQRDIVLRLQRGMDVSGRIVFEVGTAEVPTDLSRMTMSLSAAPTGSISIAINVPRVPPAADGSFKLEGIAPGRYLVSVFQPATGPGGGNAWMMKSARLGDTDVTDRAIEVRPNENLSDLVVTFTDKISELSGTLLDASGKPTSALSILLFSTDKSMWSQRSRRLKSPVRAGSDGKFKFTSVPPGEYYLAALADFEPQDIYKPEFLEQVAAAAMKVTIAEGEKKVQDIRIAGGY